MNRNNYSTNNDNSKRLAHVESEITGINTRLDGFERSIDNVTISVQNLTSLVSNRKTDWGTIISFIALLIVIGGAILLPLQNNISELKAWQQQIGNVTQNVSNQVNLNTANINQALVTLDSKINKLETDFKDRTASRWTEEDQKKFSDWVILPIQQHIDKLDDRINLHINESSINKSIPE